VLAGSNLDTLQGPACDITGATVTFTAPARDGTPGGVVTTVKTGVDIPAGTQRFVFGTVAYVINVDPGVHDVVGLASLAGTLHDAPINHTAQISKTLGTTVTQPATTLTVSASPTSGQVPLPVTYTYTESNVSSPPSPISAVTLSDSACAPVTFTGGDTNANGILETGETWTYTCRHTITRAGSSTNHVVAHGTNIADNAAAPDEIAQVTVLVTSPPARTNLTVSANPTSGVAPLAVTYTYSETNTGAAAMSSVTLTDDGCAPVRSTGGDTNANGILDRGETWTYTCGRTVTTTGTSTSHVVARDTKIADRTAAPDELAQVAVIVTGAPPPPTSQSVPAAATKLSVTASPSTGRAPLTVIYTYTEANTGAAPISGVTLTDDGCAPVKFTGGDTNTNAILDTGETWTYTCSRTIATAGTFTSHVVARGNNTSDSSAAPEELAQVSVTVQPQVVVPDTAQPPGDVTKTPPQLPRTGPPVPLLPAALVACILLATGAVFEVSANRASDPGAGEVGGPGRPSVG